jgi:hypothetical protein
MSDSDRSGGFSTRKTSLGVAGFDPGDPTSSFYDDPYEETAEGRGETEADWLDRVAGDLLSAHVEVPFERVGVAARTGFTVEEARSVLTDADRLALLTALWNLLSPGAPVLGAAVGGGPVSEAHRELLSRTGQLPALRSRSRYSLAAATGGTAEVLVDDLRPARDIVITRRLFQGDGLVDVVVEVTSIDPAVRFPVVAILGQHGEDHQEVLFLFLLTPSSDHELGGRCEITLPLNPLLTSEHLQVYGTPVDATELSGPLLAAVPGSVAAAKRPWKEAWRQAALTTPEGNPLRQAVLDGLTDRP